MTNSTLMPITFAGFSTHGLITPDGDIRIALNEIATEGILSRTHLRNTYATVTVFLDGTFIETLSLKDAMTAIESA